MSCGLYASFFYQSSCKRESPWGLHLWPRCLHFVNCTDVARCHKMVDIEVKYHRKCLVAVLWNLNYCCGCSIIFCFLPERKQAQLQLCCASFFHLHHQKTVLHVPGVKHKQRIHTTRLKEQLLAHIPIKFILDNYLCYIGQVLINACKRDYYSGAITAWHKSACSPSMSQTVAWCPSLSNQVPTFITG